MTHCISMTGFAARTGSGGGYDWQWEVRSVNGKGLDLRLRIPESTGLEATVRAAVAQVAARGNITLNLRLTRAEAADALRVNMAGLQAALAAVATVQVAARTRGIALKDPSVTDLLALRGVTEQGPAPQAMPEELLAALRLDLDLLLADFIASRRAEGAHLGAILSGHIDRIEALVAAAHLAAEDRRPQAQVALAAALERVMQSSPGVEPHRVAQELALLAVRADVTEELDRLRAHIAAARALLNQTAPIGRKFDFLVQEFVREANTLCSKSGSASLTAIGLDLKQVIDQMREQIQNVE